MERKREGREETRDAALHRMKDKAAGKLASFYCAWQSKDGAFHAREKVK
jgi:hypothetical protein